jgi:ABC-2 type transport system permease protein
MVGNMKNIFTEIRIAFEVIKMNIVAASELRVSFVLQIIGMMVNNMAFMIVWFFFMKVFGSIHGWSTIEVIALQGFVSLVFGIAFTFTSGVLGLPEYVNNGSFDSILLSPRNLYMRILTSQTRVSAMGDILSGLIPLVVYLILIKASIIQVFMLTTIIVPAVLVMINVALITSLTSFLFPDAVTLAKNLFEIFFSPSLYPSGLFQGVMRLVFIFVIPSLIIGGIPVEVVQHASWKGYALVWCLSLIWTAIGIKLLGLAVRKYESGNLTGARV